MSFGSTTMLLLLQLIGTATLMWLLFMCTSIAAFEKTNCRHQAIRNSGSSQRRPFQHHQPPSFLLPGRLSTLLSLQNDNNNNNSNNTINMNNFKRKRKRKSTTPTTLAYPQQTPHSGCHFCPTHPGVSSSSSSTTFGGAFRNHNTRTKRFFEGWYYRLTLKEQNVSFAIIVSIEDPQPSPLSLSCCQIMGPNDEYIVQADTDPTKFWAWQQEQRLGCTFEFHHHDTTTTAMTDTDTDTDTTTKATNSSPGSTKTTTFIDPDTYKSIVKTGFQITPHRIQGIIEGNDGPLRTPSIYPNVGSCDFDMSITPLSGWGDTDQPQKSTAGWLAKYSVFEPHWQVTLADARATGTIRWKNTTYTFQDAPFYAEKNWGGAFPLKWYWTQCNSFDGYYYLDKGEKPLAVTAGGGTRKIPFGQKEDLGMVSVHYDGIMYEATPWLGTMEWDIAPWGQWNMTGRSTKGERPFEVQLYSTCDMPGVLLRAPTEKDGMVYFCRDSFSTNTTLSLWELIWDDECGQYVRGRTIIHEAKSTQAAVEVGGGPWWDKWKGQSQMKQPFKGLVRFPYRILNLRKQFKLL